MSLSVFLKKETLYSSVHDPTFRHVDICKTDLYNGLQGSHHEHNGNSFRGGVQFPTGGDGSAKDAAESSVRDPFVRPALRVANGGSGANPEPTVTVWMGERIAAKSADNAVGIVLFFTFRCRILLFVCESINRPGYGWRFFC